MKRNIICMLWMSVILMASPMVKAQVTGVKYLIKYNTVTCLYECSLVITSGSASTPAQRAQFNAQFTIVVPTGTNLSIDELYMPLENNQDYTGSVPTTWQITMTEIAPPVKPEHDFYSITPSLSPTSFYNNLIAGDTLRLFGISVTGDLSCGTAIRPFINGVDPPSFAFPSGGDFSNGFTLGSPAQIYTGNLEPILPPGTKIVDLIPCGDMINMEILLGGCTTAENVQWIGPNNFSSNEFNPAIDPTDINSNGIYMATLIDEIGCTSTASVAYCHGINAGNDQIIEVFNADPVNTDLTGCGNGEWSVVTSNMTIPEIGGIDLPNAMVSIDPPSLGIYTFTYEGQNGCSDDMTIELRELEPSFIGPTSICIGRNTQLSPQSGYHWESSDPSIASIDDTGVVTAHNTGFATFTFTDIQTGKISVSSAPLTVEECDYGQLTCDDIEDLDLICDLRDLSGLQFTMFEELSGGNQPNPLCPGGGAPHNIQWIGFIAQEGNYTIHIEFSNWVITHGTGNHGAQIGIYTDCTFSQSVVCYPACNANGMSINSSDLAPGNAYYLFIDGCFDSYADYTIEVTGIYEYTYCYDPCSGSIVDVVNPDPVVSGKAFSDDNENGVYDMGEVPLRNALISIDPGDMSFLTNSEGDYSFQVPEGTYDLTATLNEGDWEEFVLVRENVLVASPCSPNNDFGFIPIPFTGISLSIANSIIRCDQNTSFYLTVENHGTESFSGTVQFDFDPLTTFIICNAQSYEVNGNTVTIDVTSLEPFTPKTYLVILKMPPISFPIPILGFCGMVYNLDLEQENQYCYSEELRCSYDPNDKRTYPDRPGETNQTLFEEYIEYTIRFQNNGNDTAFVVRIEDPLDPNMDPSSIRVVASSHDVETCIKDNVLIFLFEDINLVDSTTNFEASQGFVTFRCNAFADREELTEVFNQANIIFDTNPPIVTNEVLNTLVSQLCTDVLNERDETICFGESFEGYTETGIYADTIPLPTGCDSISVLNLEVETIGYGVHEEEACFGSTITYNDKVYDTPGIYQDTSYSDLGCISAIVELTINFSEEITETVDTILCLGDMYNEHSETGTYIDSLIAASGCDSIVTTMLEVINPILYDITIEACFGDSVEYQGIYYSEGGFYQDTTYDANNCIEEIAFILVGIYSDMDTSVDTIICEGESYLGYSESGMYSVDTVDLISGCEFVISLDLEVLPESDPDCIVGIEEIEDYQLKLFPNPAATILYVEADETIENVKIFNTSFQQVTVPLERSGNQITSLDVSNLSPGLYMVSMTIKGNTIYRKVFVQ